VVEEEIVTQPFMLRQQYQTQANALPGDIYRAGVLNAAGQNQNFQAPWMAQADNINVDNGSMGSRSINYGGYPAVSSYNPVLDMRNGYQGAANGFNARVVNADTLGLGRVSGGVRHARVVRGTGCTGCAAQGVYGLGAAADGSSWYENPWYLGAGAAAILGAVWFLTKK
jgi:hypothetical protein